MSRIRKSKKSFVIAVATLVAVGLGGSAVASAATRDNAHPVAQKSSQHKPSTPHVIYAKPYAKVTPLDPPSAAFGHTTLLEGPSFGPDGQLYFVDLTAVAGTPKVLRLNLKTKVTTPLHTDSTSSLSSLQFSPADGKIYMTDLFNGNIYRMNADGSDFTTVVSGPVLGQTMVADDIAFDKAGNLYVTDQSGDPWNPIGRVIRFDPTAKNPILIQGGLAGPNAISFSPDFSALWVSEFSMGREDHFALSADGKTVTSRNVGMTENVGVNGFDSNSVDAAGNIYQCVYAAGKIYVWNPNGDLLTTILIPQNLPKSQLSTTNLAIKPGTTDGYLTVGGENGGYIYSFRALAKGISQSNGGGAIS